MISIKCPHCQVSLNVNEGKIPLGLASFKCPNCKKSIPVSLISAQRNADEAETVIVHSGVRHPGRLTVKPDANTAEQYFPLGEGEYVIGRKSPSSGANIKIETADRSMSREHIRIEVRKDGHGGYKHYLSDNNSKNHTLYNSNYLETGEKVVLNDNDEIMIGHTILRFNY